MKIGFRLKMILCLTFFLATILFPSKTSSTNDSFNYRCNPERTGSYDSLIGPTKRLLTQWSVSLENSDNNTLIVVGDNIFVTDRSLIHRFGNNGKKICVYPVQEAHKMVSSAGYLVAYSAGKLSVIDLKANAVVDELKYPGDRCNMVVTGNYLVYAPFTYYKDETPDFVPAIYCRDLLTNRQLWKKEISDIDPKLSITNETLVISCAYFEKGQYMDKDIIECLDLTNGSVKWSKKIDLGVASDISIMDEKLFFVAYDRGLDEKVIKSLSLQDGKEIWSYQSDEIMTNSPLTLMDGKIYFHELDQVSCLDSNTGKLVWKLINVYFMCNPVLEKNKLYLYFRYPKNMTMNKSYNIYDQFDCLNVEKKKFINSKVVLGLIDEEPIISNGKIYLASNMNKKYYVYCLSNASDKVVFKLDSNICTIDGGTITMDVKPSVINNATYIPAKYLVDTLGGDIMWKNDEKKLHLTIPKKGSEKDFDYLEKHIEMWLGNSVASVNGKRVEIDPKNPKITLKMINGRAMVPMRFLAESLGCKVEWKPDTKEIFVTYQP